MTASFYRLAEENIVIFVRLTPKASKDSIDGLVEHTDGRTYLNIHIRALPEKNRANKALIKFIGKSLKLAPSFISLTKGHNARFKQLILEGNQSALIDKLNKIASDYTA